MVAPAGVAPDFGLTLAEGLGLSSQVGDMAGFFLTLGICMLLAVITGRRIWYYPAIMLLTITAVGRIVAWLAHDAALATENALPCCAGPPAAAVPAPAFALAPRFMYA